MVILIILGLVLVTLYVTGRKSVHHEIVIDASPDKVWAILTDVKGYKFWNPVMELVSGEVKEGNKVTYRFTQDKENVSTIPARVKKMIPQQLLNQAGGVPFILTFDHRYTLDAIEGGTKVTIQEHYVGVGVNFWNPKPVEAAYARLNKALKKKVESYR